MLKECMYKAVQRVHETFMCFLFHICASLFYALHPPWGKQIDPRAASSCFVSFFVFLCPRKTSLTASLEEGRESTHAPRAPMSEKQKSAEAEIGARASRTNICKPISANQESAHAPRAPIHEHHCLFCVLREGERGERQRKREEAERGGKDEKERKRETSN